MRKQKKTIRVMLVDDHKIVRDGLRNLLGTQQGIRVTEEADSGHSALEIIRAHPPDVVIMDIAMKDLNGIEATRKIRELHTGARVLALSMHGERRVISEMMRAGAAGYLLKECAFTELATAIRKVAGGGIYVSPAIAGILAADPDRKSGSPDPIPAVMLTERQRDVLRCLAEGRNNKTVADRMGISVKTVETHVAHIKEKLHLHCIAELTRYAIREGLIPE